MSQKFEMGRRMMHWTEVHARVENGEVWDTAIGTCSGRMRHWVRHCNGYML